MSDVEDAEQEAPPAVKSLRSKFEQMAIASKPPKTADSLPVPAKGATYPRPRSSSNHSLGVNESAIQQLRASASSSDLKDVDAEDTKMVALKRPPPPPPSRGLKTSISPSPSPLSRPVPLPHHAPVNETTRSSPPRDVAALREKFARPVPIPPNAPTSGTATPNGSPPRDMSALRERFSGHDLTRQPSGSTSKPPVPPRPSFVISRSPDHEDNHPMSDSPVGMSVSEAGAAPTERLGRRAPPPPSPESRSRPINDSDSDTTGASSSSSVAPAQPRPPPPPRPSRFAGFPLPPPRHRTSLSPNPGSFERTPAPSTNHTHTLPPPPLPFRRVTVGTPPAPDCPPLPQRSPPPRRTTMARPTVISGLPPELNGLNESPGPSPIDRKPFGSARLPPPPTRTIALGDRLPAPRRVEVSSDDEEVVDEEPARILDSLPDTSGSSRRVPAISFREGFPAPKLTFHPHSGCVIASGPNLVVAHIQHIKIYNLEVSDTPLFDLEMKQLGMKEAKVLCMEFRPSLNPVDRGCVVWFGTKDGSILEMDIRIGKFTAVKSAAHFYPVTHIFRRGRSMVTLDESGKVLIFSPDPENPEKDVSLTQTMTRTVRTTDKHDFVKLLDGKLWTASRNEHQAGSALNRGLPVIRVYDIFNPATPAKSMFPTEYVGQVTTATILPSQPDRIFMGHEEGYVSMWELDTEDGWPRCVETMKVSVSDIVSLEGVHERLWAGSRNGYISAYDVSQRPWVLTNCWNAHPGLPVQKIFVNFRAIEANRKLCVVSLGRDEQIKLWDGLLGVDWVENELVKNESSFSTFQDITALVVSWNCDAARPDSLADDRRNAEFFNTLLTSVDEPPDIISFSFQEVIDLESRKMAAKNMILGSKKKDADALSDRVTGAYKRWHDKLVHVVKTVYSPQGVEYTAVNTESMVGLFSCIFLKNSKGFVCREKNIAAIKRGMGGRYGNKGAVIARVVIGDSSLCFINCHLAAGQHALKQRNSDVAAILEEKGVFEPSPLEAAYVGGGDGTMVLDHEFVLLNGDLNYRIDLGRREAYLSSFRSGDLSNLLAHDQLLTQMKTNKTFRLRGFSEGHINFLPTYKYDPRSDEYDTSEKRRHPAWCDRILWRSRVPNRVQQLHYRRYEVNVSDHRPISAAFTIRVKNIQPEARQRSKAIVEAAWADEQVRILDAAQKFYVRQALL